MTPEQANAIHQAGVHPQSSPSALSRLSQQFGARRKTPPPTRGIHKILGSSKKFPPTQFKSGL